ncbi:MAG: sigma-Y antisigma factor component [Bacillota bacterium]|nr:sigma-Y antisigma factor component [Bacillota bacterium]MDP4169796.1 sigma-Y antisigma factor component [Bacillota bacterium]
MNRHLTPSLIVLLAVILLAQSIFLFLNARKHNHNYWLWGIIGLFQAPIPILLYLIFVRKILQKNK